MTSILTSITPVSNLAMLLKADLDKSIIRPFTKGPLSLIITMTLLLLLVFGILDRLVYAKLGLKKSTNIVDLSPKNEQFIKQVSLCVDVDFAFHVFYCFAVD
jgi:hypothetical protein